MSALERNPKRPMSSIGADSASTEASKRPDESTTPVVKLSLLIATITRAGFDVTCVNVLTMHPAFVSSSCAVITYTPQLIARNDFASNIGSPSIGIARTQRLSYELVRIFARKNRSGDGPMEQAMRSTTKAAASRSVPAALSQLPRTAISRSYLTQLSRNCHAAASRSVPAVLSQPQRSRLAL